MKNAHLLCCAANRTTQRIFIYASRFGFLRALHLNIFEQPLKSIENPFNDSNLKNNPMSRRLMSMMNNLTFRRQIRT